MKNKKLFLGDRIRRAWKEIRNEKENVIYADAEYIKTADLEEIFSVLSEYLELDIRLTARQDDFSVKNLVTLNSLDEGGIYWHGCGKKMFFRNPEQKTGDKYCDAILALEKHRGSVVLSPMSLLNTVFSDESVRLCSDIQIFYRMIRPLVIERDSHSNLPRKKNYTERPNGCRISGWLSYAMLEAARKSLFPLEIIDTYLLQQKNGNKINGSNDPYSILMILQSILHRFKQVLTCRNEIDWSYFEAGDIHYRFDHLLLLGTAMLDQLAGLVSAMADGPSYGMEISLNPQRGKKTKKDAMRSAIDKMTPEEKERLEDSFCISFRDFLYSFRNIVAHRKPSIETIRYSCSVDQPEGILFPVSDQQLLDKALILLDTKKGLVEQAIIRSEDISVDPLIMSWFITNELSMVTRIVLNDCLKRLELPLHYSSSKKQGFDRLIAASIPIMDTWNMPT